MPTTSQIAGPPDGGQRRSRRPASSGLLASLAILAGSLIVGIAGGLVWTVLAPQAVYVIIARGSANVINPETTAFIAADGWYCLIGAVGGALIGLAGYFLAVRRHGPLPMASVLIGAVIAGIAARVTGERHGLGHFNQLLLTSRPGTVLHAPLGLAGDTSAVFWPTKASVPALAFWPLAACLVAGGIVLVGVLRDRSANRYQGPDEAFEPFPS
jgi:hypothetical protein